jgi:diguanylate cyclase (GGDEF)-like protein
MKELTFPQKTLDVGNKARWLMLALILLGLQFYRLPEEAWPQIYLLLAILAVYNTVSRFIHLPNIWERSAKVCYAETTMDTVFITGLVHITGGIDSPFWIFYIIVIMFSAVYYRIDITFLITFSVSLLYLLLVILAKVPMASIISSFSLRIPILFACAGFSIFLSTEIRSTVDELEFEKEKLRHLLRAFQHNMIEIQKKNNLLSEVYNISLEIGANLSLKEQLEIVVRATHNFLKADHTSIYLTEKEELKLMVKEGTGLLDAEVVKVGDALIGRCAETNEHLLIDDLSIYKEEESPFSSAMVAPLAVDKELLGIFCVASTYPKKFTEDHHLRFFLLIACRASLAIKNAKLHEEIRRMAITDELTGLYNYRYFLEILKKEVQKAKRFSSDLSLLMIDIDHFKEFNDTYGHHFGNQLLANLALELNSHLRAMDFLARFGGEEFVAILPEANKEEGMMVAERIRRAVCKKKIVKDTEPVTVSIGVASFPVDGRKEDDIILAADKAMYQAKQAGRNRSVAF